MKFKNVGVVNRKMIKIYIKLFFFKFLFDVLLKTGEYIDKTGISLFFI